jgi:hypothetical protein
MIQRKSISFLVFFVVVALPALASPARYAITAEQVATAVTGQGVHVSPDQVVLLTRVVAQVDAPKLIVKSVDRVGPERAIARLECADSEQCLPFIVSIRMAGSKNADLIAAPSNFLPSARSQTRPARIAVRAGSQAILLLDGPHVHISLAVICLENGAPGQTIRATDQDHRQIYTVRVTQDGILEGRL